MMRDNKDLCSCGFGRGEDALEVPAAALYSKSTARANRIFNVYHIRDIISHVSQFVPARLNRCGPPMDDGAKGSTRHAHDFGYSFDVFRAVPAMSFRVIVRSSQHRHFRRLSSSSAARL